MASAPQDALPAQIRVQRFFRPEDVSSETAYAAGFHDIYAPPAPAKGKAPEGAWVQWIKPAVVVSKCIVGPTGMPQGEQCSWWGWADGCAEWNWLEADLSAQLGAPRATLLTLPLPALSPVPCPCQTPS